MTMHQSEIRLLHRAPRKLGRERLMSRIGSRDQEDATRAFIEAMYDAGAHLARHFRER